MNRLPNLFLLGVQKAATSSLFETLRRAEAIGATDPKETEFFLGDEYERGPEALQAYLRNVDADDRHIVEASICNFAVPHTAERIAAMCGPDCRFILVLREPFERVRSAYWYLKARGLEQDSLPDALEHETSRIARMKSEGLPWWRTAYLKNTAYGTNLQCYLQHFHREQFFICRYDDVVTRPEELLIDLDQWAGLGLESSAAAAELGKKRNAAADVKSSTVDRFRKVIFDSDSLPKRAFQALVPQELRQAIYRKAKALNENEKVNPELEPDEKRLIAEGLAGEIELLQELSGQDFSDWIDELALWRS